MTFYTQEKETCNWCSTQKNVAFYRIRPQSCLLQEQKWIWKINVTPSQLQTPVHSTQMSQAKMLASIHIFLLPIMQAHSICVFEKWTHHGEYCFCLYFLSLCAFFWCLVLIHMSQSTSISHAAVPENSSVVSLNFSLQQVWMASENVVTKQLLPSLPINGVVGFGCRHKYYHAFFSSSA